MGCLLRIDNKYIKKDKHKMKFQIRFNIPVQPRVRIFKRFSIPKKKKKKKRTLKQTRL